MAVPAADAPQTTPTPVKDIEKEEVESEETPGESSQDWNPKPSAAPGISLLDDADKDVDTASDDEPLDLEFSADYDDDDDIKVVPNPNAASEPSTPKIATGKEADGDDLLLDASNLVEKDTAEDAKPLLKEKPAPRVASGGGTLFERMANLSRGGGKSASDELDDESDDGEDNPLNIPRFLNRQNNQ